MKRALIRFVSTQDDTGVFIARIILSIVILPHGAQLLLGLFGGNGFSASMASLSSSGIPSVIAFLVIMSESLGALALFLGFFGRFMAFGIGLTMLGAMLLVHLPYGFFMNWYGTQKGEGFEYHLLAIGLALLLMVKGSGRFSSDRLIVKLLKKDQ